MFLVLGIVGVCILFYFLKNIFRCNYNEKCPCCFEETEYFVRSIAPAYVDGVCEECAHEQWVAYLQHSDMRQINGPAVTASHFWWTLIAITIMFVIACVITFFLVPINWLRGRYKSFLG